MIPTPELKIGQVWADNDRRSDGRTFQITRMDDRFVHAVVLTDCTFVTRATVGKTIRIARRRMRPTNNGYYLVKEPACPGT